MEIAIDKILDGNTLKKMLLSGASSLKQNTEIINNLNVFPVPDGDTGTNMKMTFESGINHIDWNSEEGVGTVSEKLARGMLLGARGNSGVILSQIFKGISLGLIGKDNVNAFELIDAFEQGIKQSYEAVSKPVEGTILTVFREATENVKKVITKETSIEKFFEMIINEGEKSLQNTPNLLPILKEAGVVDSGGAGLLCIFKGMIGDVNNLDYNIEELENLNFKETKEKVFKKIQFNESGSIDYAYCTEFLIQLQDTKVDVKEFDEKTIRKELEALDGESIVTFKEEDIVKVHVHTFNPGKVLEIGQQYGEFISVKIENMALQHSDVIIENKYSNGTKQNKALITVAKDEGFIKLFNDMGADYIVNGGNTMNPSADDFLKAFEKVNAENIIVLPNNSNIELAVKQAKEMFTSSNVYIIPTKTLGEGYSLLALYNKEDDLENILEVFNDEITNVTTIDVTKAVRDASLNGYDIHKDNYIGICEKTIYSTNIDLFTCVKDALSNTINNNHSILTIFLGKDSSIKEDELDKYINENFPRLEVYYLNTQQDNYNYIFVLE